MPLKIFVIVIPKKRIGGLSPATPSFVVTPTLQICEEYCVQFYSQCHTRRRIGRALQLFFWYDTDRDPHVRFSVTQLINRLKIHLHSPHL